MSPERKRLAGLIGISLVVLAILIFIGVRSDYSSLENFELNKDGIIEFFVQNIDQVVPGEDWEVTEIRFATSDRSYDGVYVKYEKASLSEAFLMLVNPVEGDIDYEIVGVFDVKEDGSIELVSGVDSFAGEDQEVWKILNQNEWEKIN